MHSKAALCCLIWNANKKEEVHAPLHFRCTRCKGVEDVFTFFNVQNSRCKEDVRFAHQRCVKQYGQRRGRFDACGMLSNSQCEWKRLPKVNKRCNEAYGEVRWGGVLSASLTRGGADSILHSAMLHTSMCCASVVSLLRTSYLCNTVLQVHQRCKTYDACATPVSLASHVSLLCAPVPYGFAASASCSRHLWFCCNTP